MMTPQFRRVQAARTALLLDQPFFGVLALQLKLIEDATIGNGDPSRQTMCTNGSVIKFHPAFVDSCSHDQLVAVLAHETMHCALGHPWRREAREIRKANRAMDYAINPLLTAANFKLPAGHLDDPQYHGKSFEWIYDRLPDSNDPNGGNGGNGADFGQVEDAQTGPDTDGNQPLSEGDWQQATKQAEASARARGTLPGHLQGAIDALTKPRVDWKSALRRFVQQVVAADYDWRRPNRRYIHAGVYLPDLRSESCGRLAVAVDTSGSIDSTTLSQFASEINAIASEVQPSHVDVIYCDSRVQHVDTFARSEPITIAMHGGGGTDFCPVFEHIAAMDDPPVAVVYLTDLDGSFPDSPPDVPTVWCSTNPRSVAPFGETIPLE